MAAISTAHAIAAPVSPLTFPTGSISTNLAGATDRVDRDRWLLAGYIGVLAVASFWNATAKNNLMIADVLTVQCVVRALAFAGLFAMLVRARIAGRLAPMLNQAVLALAVACGWAVADQYLQPVMSLPIYEKNLLANLIGAASAFLIFVSPAGRSRLGVVTPWTTRVLMVLAVAPLCWLAVTPAGLQMMIRMARSMAQYMADPTMFDDYCHIAGGALMLVALVLACPATRRFGRAGMVTAITLTLLAAPAIEFAQQALGRSGHMDPVDIFRHMQGFTVALVGLSLLMAAVNLISPAAHLAAPAPGSAPGSVPGADEQAQTDAPAVLSFARDSEPLRKAA